MLENRRITGYHLKMIALVTMLIDHIAAVVIWRMIAASYTITGSMQVSGFVGDQLIIWIANNREFVYTIYDVMRLVGRMAFPIYCFLLVEGFRYTKSVSKYAFRLLLFAIISEVPFDLALTGQWWNAEYSNVFFTLLIGLLLIWILSYVEKFYEFWKEKGWDNTLGRFVTIIPSVIIGIIFSALAEMVLHTDYGFAGVLTILILYVFRSFKEFAFVVAVLALTSFTSSTELLALLMLLPLAKYDGTRGKNIKYVFYAFYPVHLLILALICIGLGV